MNKDRTEILIGGIGGQGVVYSANLIARAGLIRHKFASSIAHYGPESRGSVTTSEVVISNSTSNEPDYPVVETADVFIAMHPKAYEKYIAGHAASPRHLIYDSTLVTITPELKIGNSEFIQIPATQLAKDKLGNIMMANIILTAVFAKVTNIISRGDLEASLEKIVHSKDLALNQEALNIGFKTNQ